MPTRKIMLDHGSGGKISHGLISDIVLPLFDNPLIAPLDDGAILDINGTRLAFSTDTYTVTPLFFPGGDIGELAVNGTVNDIAMCGAVPLYMSVGLIIEEGFPMSDLKSILNSMSRAAKGAGVRVVTGDTKVVPGGTADGIFINTACIGLLGEKVHVAGDNARSGDRIILSGTMADHGITILTEREGMSLDSPLESDTAALNHMVGSMLETGGDIHVLRDPTRGGVGTALKEIALSSGVDIMIEEGEIPVREAVAGICDLMGFDPLYMANEGKLLAFVAPGDAERVLEAMKKDVHGREARIIGEVLPDGNGMVYMKTRIGGARIIDMLTGEQLPRIC